MSKIVTLLDNTVSQKMVTALTGLGLVGFVIVHMVGNLQVFAGQDALNSYAAKLKGLGPLLWGARIGLLAIVSLHIAMAVRLAMRNRNARGRGYAIRRPQSTNASSRFMIVSGFIILVFILFHLAHFTFGWIQPDLFRQIDVSGRHDVYSMVTGAFAHWGIAAFYIVCMLFLLSHLSHAMYSAFQSLGICMVGGDLHMRRWAKWCAAATIIGFTAVPLAVMAGWFQGTQ